MRNGIANNKLFESSPDSVSKIKSGMQALGLSEPDADLFFAYLTSEQQKYDRNVIKRCKEIFRERFGVLRKFSPSSVAALLTALHQIPSDKIAIPGTIEEWVKQTQQGAKKDLRGNIILGHALFTPLVQRQVSPRLNDRARNQLIAKLHTLSKKVYDGTAEIFLEYLLTGEVPEGVAEIVRGSKDRIRNLVGFQGNFSEPCREATLAMLRDLSGEDIVTGSKAFKDWVNKSCNGRVVDLYGRPVDGLKLFTAPAESDKRKKKPRVDKAVEMKEQAATAAPLKLDAKEKESDQDFKALFLCVDSIFGYSCKNGPLAKKPEWYFAPEAFTYYLEGKDISNIKDLMSQGGALDTISFGDFRLSVSLCMVEILSLHQIKITDALSSCKAVNIPLNTFMLYCTQLAYAKLPQQSGELGDISCQRWPEKHILPGNVAELCDQVLKQLTAKPQQKKNVAASPPKNAEPAQSQDEAEEQVDKRVLTSAIKKHLIGTSAHNLDMFIGIFVDGKAPKDFVGAGFIQEQTVRSAALAILANRFKIPAKFQDGPDGIDFSPSREEILKSISRKLSAENSQRQQVLSRLWQNNRD